MGSDRRLKSRQAGPQMSEAALVALARLRDEAAVRELIRRLNGRLFRIARGLMPSDAEAEEVLQDAYLAAFTHLDGFRDEARFSTWITRITLNCAAMRLRKARPLQEYDTVTETAPPSAEVLPFPGTGSEPTETAIARMQTRALIEAAVGELPPDLRLVFLMHEAAGMDLREIASDLSLPLGTVKTRLMRARGRLRRLISDRINGGFEAIFPFAGSRCAQMADRVAALLSACRDAHDPAAHEPASPESRDPKPLA